MIDESKEAADTQETLGIKGMFFWVSCRVSKRRAALRDAFECSLQSKCVLIVLLAGSLGRADDCLTSERGRRNEKLFNAFHLELVDVLLQHGLCE